MSDEEAPRDEGPSLVRLVLLRGLLLGVGLGLVFTLALWDLKHLGFGPAVAGLGAGVILAATTVVEVVALRREPTKWRAVRGAGAASLVAFGGVWVAIFQVPYTTVAIGELSTVAAFKAVETTWDRVKAIKGDFFGTALVVAAIFGVATFVRLAGLGARGRLVGSVLVAPVACVPGLLLMFVRQGSAQASIVFCVLGCLVAVPLFLETADTIERRLRGRART